MAVDMFIKLDDVKGESQDKTHPDEIDVLAWSWGMSQSGTMHTGGGGGGGKVSVQDLSFTKWIDKSSSVLMDYCSGGKQFKEALLTVRKAGGAEPLEYLKITMGDVIVTSVSTGGSGGEDRLTENVTLNFSDGQDGLSAAEAGWHQGRRCGRIRLGHRGQRQALTAGHGLPFGVIASASRQLHGRGRHRSLRTLMPPGERPHASRRQVARG